MNVWGKSFGRMRVTPSVSPGKTLAGLIGGVATTVILAAVIGPFLTPMDWKRSLVAGAIIGLINGLLIVKMRVPDLLATLGMMFLLVGLQRIPTQGRSIAQGMSLPNGQVAQGTFSKAFLALGRYRFDFFIDKLIPVSVIFLLVLGFVVWVFMEKTRHGRLMYAIGSNARAAALAGANVNHYKILAYMISTADISAMREAGSAWVATAATNPAVVGEVSVRTLAMLLAGQDPGHSVIIPPTLITQKMLNDNDIKNMADLSAKLPQFAHADVSVPDWMPLPPRK